MTRGQDERSTTRRRGGRSVDSAVGEISVGVDRHQRAAEVCAPDSQWDRDYWTDVAVSSTCVGCVPRGTFDNNSMRTIRKSYCGAADCPGRKACRSCANIYARTTRPRWSELTPEARRRANCRSYTAVLQKRGKLPKGPCEGCGSDDAQNHHLDYDKPREFLRLCRECHGALHLDDDEYLYVRRPALLHRPIEGTWHKAQT